MTEEDWGWFDAERSTDPFDDPDERTVPTSRPTRSTEQHYDDAMRALDAIHPRQQ